MSHLDVLTIGALAGDRHQSHKVALEKGATKLRLYGQRGFGGCLFRAGQTEVDGNS